MQKTSSHMIITSVTPSKLRAGVVITLLLLAVQFLIGMVVNLYVQVPSAHPGAQAPEYFTGVVQGIGWVLVHGTWSLWIHTVIGLLLVLASFILLGLSIAARQRAWIITSVLGLMGILGAGFNGASFLNYGHDFSSLIMSACFLLAVISYTVGFFITC